MAMPSAASLLMRSCCSSQRRCARSTWRQKQRSTWHYTQDSAVPHDERTSGSVPSNRSTNLAQVVWCMLGYGLKGGELPDLAQSSCTGKRLQAPSLCASPSQHMHGNCFRLSVLGVTGWPACWRRYAFSSSSAQLAQCLTSIDAPKNLGVPTTMAEGFRARVEGALGFSEAAAASVVAASLAASFAATAAFLPLPFLASLAGATALSALWLSLALLRVTVASALLLLPGSSTGAALTTLLALFAAAAFLPACSEDSTLTYPPRLYLRCAALAHVHVMVSSRHRHSAPSAMQQLHVKTTCVPHCRPHVSLHRAMSVVAITDSVGTLVWFTFRPSGRRM